jgi:hypothetical protein
MRQVPFSLGGGLHSLDGLFEIFHRNRQRLQRFGSEGPDLTQRSAAETENGVKKKLERNGQEKRRRLTPCVAASPAVAA